MSKPKKLGEQLVDALRFHDVDAVIDIGANQGQYGQRLRRYGYEGPIQSFEPLPDIHQRLVDAADCDPDWHVAAPSAIGDVDGSIDIYRSKESDMSSILPQNDLHRSISPSSAIEERTRVKIQRLDRPGVIHDQTWSRLFVKMDVQGYEPAVLEGMAALWSKVAGLQLEMALIETYEGEVLWQQMIDRIESRGFFTSLLIPGYYERKLGRQLQVDGVFFKKTEN